MSSTDHDGQFRALLQDDVPPRVILNHLAPNLEVPSGASEETLWRLVLSLIEPPKRKRLPQFNTIEHAVDLIRQSKNIVVLSGAGISTSAGLPDFRSKNGIYVKIHEDYPDLWDPKLMFEIEYFRKNPKPFYQFAKALFPGQFKPTIGHQFIKAIERNGKLLRNYTQNIDTLERHAGIERLVECHGSFSKATCTNCKFCVDGDAIRDDVLNQKVPKCPKCHSSDECPSDGLGVLKPNIVFFGEQLGTDFHNSFEADKNQVDLLIVIGSSLKVRPVALIPRSVPADVPQILINKEPLDHMQLDIELLGDCDYIIQELCLRLGGCWTSVCETLREPMTQLIGPHNLQIAPDSPDKQSAADVLVREASSAVADEEQVLEKSALTECNKDDSTEDDDWEDVEVLLDNSSSSSSDNNDESSMIKVSLLVPKASFIYVSPNKYFFEGAEITQEQYDSLTKEHESS